MKTFNNTWKICLSLGLTTGATLAGLIVNPHYFFFAVVFGLATAIFTATHGKQRIH
jgi:hypothetical protein